MAGDDDRALLLLENMRDLCHDLQGSPLRFGRTDRKHRIIISVGEADEDASRGRLHFDIGRRRAAEGIGDLLLQPRRLNLTGRLICRLRFGGKRRPARRHILWRDLLGREIGHGGTGRLAGCLIRLLRLRLLRRHGVRLAASRRSSRSATFRSAGRRSLRRCLLRNFGRGHLEGILKARGGSDIGVIGIGRFDRRARGCDLGENRIRITKQGSFRMGRQISRAVAAAWLCASRLRQSLGLLLGLLLRLLLRRSLPSGRRCSVVRRVLGCAFLRIIQPAFLNRPVDQLHRIEIARQRGLGLLIGRADQPKHEEQGHHGGHEIGEGDFPCAAVTVVAVACACA